MKVQCTSLTISNFDNQEAQLISASDLCIQLSLPAGLFTPAGSESCTKAEGQPLLTHGSAAFGTKRTVRKNSKMFSGSKLA
jgi:hypothetical protein